MEKAQVRFNFVVSAKVAEALREFSNTETYAEKTLAEQISRWRDGKVAGYATITRGIVLFPGSSRVVALPSVSIPSAEGYGNQTVDVWLSCFLNSEEFHEFNRTSSFELPEKVVRIGDEVCFISEVQERLQEMLNK